MSASPFPQDHPVRVEAQTARLEAQPAVIKPFQHTSMPMVEPPRFSWRAIPAPFAHYSTNCKFLQIHSGRSGQAIPAFFHAKMHPKLYLSLIILTLIILNFWSIPNKDSASKHLQLDFLQEPQRSSWQAIPAYYNTQRHSPPHSYILCTFCAVINKNSDCQFYELWHPSNTFRKQWTS